jgi:hypothetical protein
MAYLKERLHECKQYRAYESPLIDAGPVGLTGDWPAFLSGFVTAEAHFGIGQSAVHRFRPFLRVNLRGDDDPLLTELCGRTMVGRTYRYPNGAHGRPTASWAAFSARDLLRIVKILDGFPPRGRKLREYKVWREAALVYGSDGPRPEIHARLGKLRDELLGARAYPPAGDG